MSQFYDHTINDSKGIKTRMMPSQHHVRSTINTHLCQIPIQYHPILILLYYKKQFPTAEGIPRVMTTCYFWTQNVSFRKKHQFKFDAP